MQWLRVSAAASKSSRHISLPEQSVLRVCCPLRARRLLQVNSRRQLLIYARDSRSLSGAGQLTPSNQIQYKSENRLPLSLPSTWTHLVRLAASCAAQDDEERVVAQLARRDRAFDTWTSCGLRAARKVRDCDAKQKASINELGRRRRRRVVVCAQQTKWKYAFAPSGSGRRRCGCDCNADVAHVVVRTGLPAGRPAIGSGRPQVFACLAGARWASERASNENCDRRQ